MTSITLPSQVLRFGFRDAPIGIILAAVSENGVASIFVGNDRERLQRDLAAAFPANTFLEDELAIAQVLAKIADTIENPRKPFDLPLDLHGSETELAVWAALRTVPVGQTRTYGQIAKALPIAATAQEVGAACAANVLAVAVPCHRVIKADGSISGYRWGVARKRKLLEIEAAA
jgi:AraC family transcriptional regulator of adaptative response/methylated-DNA-[protein]-cysteine methyltransferase